ncbi:AAA family ATPase [Maribacter dokdonensis]|uniref:AAA family ATPase n=1 Tax=Maribacter dokdonensis TaxID=320912 RepID=UPI001C09E1E4|nr:AAA family ATPase [Maribacter dokdonensis]MBU2902336.1 AAA family ATPase [Maribacter dokdonensis]
MKIEKLHIEDFRHIKNETIEFGERLTVISGQNGTGKSSVLGWVAQLCDFKAKNKRLNDEFFKEDYSNVFMFCPLNDYNYNYKVKFYYKNENELLDEEKIITTRLQKQTEKSKLRYRTDFDSRGKALDFPVIYLGLKRLIPFATERNVRVKNVNVPDKYINSFSNLSKEILLLIDDKINPEPVRSVNKNTLAMKTELYSHLGNSAGQDNVGQIASSLLSYQKLKDELGNDYEGGILLIDEIDASLYAGSQIKLIDKLYRYAVNLDLQIIFTTHSLEIIQHLEGKLGEETKINHLVIRDGLVNNVINPTYDYIANKIKNQIQKNDEINKKNFICEDKVAQYWVNNLLNGTDIKKMIKVEKGPFADGTIVSMSQTKHSLFKDVGFILDGDVKKKFENKRKPLKTVFLPETSRPETIMYQFLKDLSDNDAFWDDNANFTKQTCFADYPGNNKGTHKRWFEDAHNKKFFGNTYSKLFNRWKKDNKPSVLEFQNELRKMI